MANWASVARLGDPSQEDWRRKNLRTIEPIKGQRWEVYQPASAAFEGLLNDLIKLGYHPTSSGGYNYRNIRGSDQLSQHAFGNAIDLNSMTNAMGQSATDIPHAAELAKKWGLEWGGNWKNRPDPMHFEWLGGDTGAGQMQGPEAPPDDPHAAFVQNLWPMAVEQSRLTGVDPRIIMAQTIQETGWGKSAPNNNYFGIKGPGGSQKTLEFINGRMTPTEANFRGYKDPSESFADYGKFLMGDRYKGLREAKGLEAQAAALQASGYATDPNYGASILKIAQGIPENGYPGPVGPGVVQPSDGTTQTAAVTPKETVKETWKEKFRKGAGEAFSNLGNMAGGGGQAPASTITDIPQAALAANTPTLIGNADTGVADAQRQRLAQMMARLNSQKLWV